MYEGETIYSLKGSSMAYDVYVGGKSLQTVGEAADVNTERIVAQYIAAGAGGQHAGSGEASREAGREAKTGQGGEAQKRAGRQGGGKGMN